LRVRLPVFVRVTVEAAEVAGGSVLGKLTTVAERVAMGAGAF